MYTVIATGFQRIKRKIIQFRTGTEYGSLLFHLERARKIRSILQDALKELNEIEQMVDGVKADKIGETYSPLTPAWDRIGDLIRSYDLKKIIDLDEINHEHERKRTGIADNAKLIDWSAQGFTSEGYFISFQVTKARIAALRRAMDDRFRAMRREERQCKDALEEMLGRA